MLLLRHAGNVDAKGIRVVEAEIDDLVHAEGEIVCDGMGVELQAAKALLDADAAEGRWRAVNGSHLVALVRAGARFEKGRLIERPKEAPEEEIDEVAA